MARSLKLKCLARADDKSVLLPRPNGERGKWHDKPEFRIRNLNSPDSSGLHKKTKVRLLLGELWFERLLGVTNLPFSGNWNWTWSPRDVWRWR